ncbi:MAG: histidine kinase dimerization/phospho-acceptor domain-containing protein, partial [Myxococcota bacterium]
MQKQPSGEASQKSEGLLSLLHEEAWQRVLQQRLLRIMVLRLVLSSLLLLFTLIVQWRHASRGEQSTHHVVFWLVGMAYIVTLLYAVWLPRLRDIRGALRFGLFQVCADLFLVSVLVLATGIQDSLFLFLYMVVIIEGAVVLTRSMAFGFAALGQLLLGLLLWSSLRRWTEGWTWIRQPSVMEFQDFLYVLLVYGTALLLVVFLASHLAEQLMSSRVLIEEKQTHIDTLLTQHDDLRTLHRDIVMSLNSGLITTDLRGAIQFLNPGASEILGRVWFDLELQDAQGLLKLLPEVPWDDFQVSDGPSPRLEFSYLHPNGEKKILGMSYSPLRDRQEVQIGWLILFQDLSPIKAIEQRARNHERLAAVGELAAGLAHEIRNPLAALSGAIQVLHEEVEQGSQAAFLMDIVFRETERLNRLLSEFLLFAKPKDLHVGVYDVRTLIEENLILFAQDERLNGIDFKPTLPECCRIHVDRDLFEQVIWNVSLNAAQAMEHQGCVKIHAAREKQGVCIEICDQGGGIPVE